MYDSAQFVKQHWFNRNRIKTLNDIKWLTIPVITAGRLGQPLNKVEIAKPWADQHWSIIKLAYERAPFFAQFEGTVKGWYELADKQALLTETNAIFLKGIAELLGLSTRIVSDAAYPATGDRMERLLRIVQAAGASQYLSGPSARAYFDESMFAAAHITTEWMNYDNYSEYPQINGEFEHAVSILDMIFNTGSETRKYMSSSSLASTAG